MLFFKKHLRGYTLIELLVSISIIALLTVIGVTNFRVANQKARDGKRKGDLEQIKAALEMYRSGEGDYPTGTISLFPDYMDKIPTDPADDSVYYYSTSDGGLTYVLCATLDLETSGSCSGSGDYNYQLSSPL